MKKEKLGEKIKESEKNIPKYTKYLFLNLDGMLILNHDRITY